MHGTITCPPVSVGMLTLEVVSSSSLLFPELTPSSTRIFFFFYPKALSLLVFDLNVSRTKMDNEVDLSTYLNEAEGHILALPFSSIIM